MPLAASPSIAAEIASSAFCAPMTTLKIALIMISLTSSANATAKTAK